MLKRVKASKNKSLTPSILESMAMAVTLSDRLKQAGIRECEPDCGTKTDNLCQNRKNQPKKELAEKRNERKKLQNLGKEFYSPHAKDCCQNKTSREKTTSTNYSGFSKTLRRKIRGSAKKTIFASLDFIKDCQKYKINVRNPKKYSEIKKERKNESVFSNHKQNLHVKEEPQKLHTSKTYSQLPLRDSIKKNEGALILDIWKDKEAENSSARKDPLVQDKRRKDPSFFDQNNERVNMKKESNNDEEKSQSNKKISETLSYVKPFFNEFPSGDVARIDKKYLQSLLSITNRKDKKCTNENKNKEEAAREKHSQRKGKKKPNETSPEGKIRIKKSEEKKGAAEEMQKDSESIQIPSYKDLALAKVIRDSTKSEAQIFVRKNNFYKQINSEMKSEKNMAHIKPEVNDTHKNRKNRNKLLKSKNEEFSDSVFPNEITKVVDVEELWRRDIRKKSENSLSSNSSCTVPKSDADPEQKNLELESYKFLKKFVEEEVKKMTDESEKKNNLKEVESMENNFKTNGFKPVNIKESENVENICKKLKISMAENLNDETDITKNEICSLKKKLAQDERHSIYEGEKINSTLLNALAEEKLKDQNGKKKLIKKRGKGSEKTPSQIINNWSILNRLEQAFLVIGTPNFQNENVKNPKALKSEKVIINKKISPDTSRKSQVHLEKTSKKPQKSKEGQGKMDNKGDNKARDSSNSLNSTPKTARQSKSPKSNDQRIIMNDNQQKNKFKRENESQNESSQTNTSAKITEDKKISATQGEKKLSNQKIHENLKKKPTVRSTVKPKIIVHELRQAGRKQDRKSSLKVCCYTLANKKNPYQKNLPKAPVKNKNSEETLERKKAFDIIQKKDLYAVQLRKSKSCDKTDNFELDNVKKRLVRKKNQELKKDNKKDKPTSQDTRSLKKEPETKTKSFIPKKLLKTLVEKKPESCEKNKSAEGKKDSKVPSESSEKTPESETAEEKPSESVEVKEDSKESLKSSAKTPEGKTAEEKPDESVKVKEDSKESLKSSAKTPEGKTAEEKPDESVEVKEDSKEPLKSSVKTPEGKTAEEKPDESVEIKEDSKESLKSSVKIPEGKTAEEKPDESVEIKEDSKESLKSSVKTPEGKTAEEKPDESVEVKEDSKESLKSSAKTPEGKTAEENENEIDEFPDQKPEKKGRNNSNERVIKERSILSISGKSQNLQESTKKLMQIERKMPSDFFLPSQVSNTENSETEKSQSDFLESSTEVTQQSNYSTISSLDISNFKLDFDSSENRKEVDFKSQRSNSLELSKILMPLPNTSNKKFISARQQVSEVEKKETELKVPKCQTKMLWEQDIRYYRVMVQEIMSHYNRINGFLTHSDYMQSFSSDSVDQLSIKNSTDQDPMSDKPLKMNLHEYRKKIMSEYQALPIFEYKKQRQEKKEVNLLKKEATKRNLMVAKNITSEMDLDVKDYQPKFHKVLGSQLYVDEENLSKRNHPKNKFKEKKSSLQEIVLDKNEKMIQQECLRRSSTSKTFPLLSSSSVYFETSQKLKNMGGFQEDLMESITSVSVSEETESEYL